MKLFLVALLVVTVLGLVGGAPGGGDTARRSREGLDDRLGEGFGRLRVLASDELSALCDDDVRRPGVALGVLAALALKTRVKETLVKDCESHSDVTRGEGTMNFWTEARLIMTIAL
jgi:hypothetical protein